MRVAGASPRPFFIPTEGSQYTSGKVRGLLSRSQWQQSMSAKGYCYDNAFAESCFATIKAEIFPKNQRFESVKAARMALFDYLETFYNRRRKHSSLGNKAPFEFLELYIKSQKQYLN